MAEVLPSDELIDEPSDYGSIQPRTRLGRYELLVPIARGGMARVWAARLHGQRGFQKLVAIKTILPHLADEPEFERMFLDEARIASGVHHPNVCEIYELGEEKRTLYLAMEWVSGDSLARVLRSTGKTEALDARVVARIIADASAGLHAAHELTDDDGRALGVVHRDLSPHNILLTADGTAKVADFGVAKALGQLHEETSAGQLKGKIAYMAPEQVTGSPVDRRSDVFSLGCVLYEATTGQRPFRGDGDHQVMHAVLKGEVAPPTSLVRGYPQELERIVMRALAAQPILRYPTAERMRFALEEFIARGQLVTQSNVAQLVRARIGDQIERRKERIRQASVAGDNGGAWSEPPPGGMTPSNQASGGHRSGVKAASANARPLFTTMQMERSPSGPPGSVAPPPLPAMASAAGAAHTPVSHPGAAHAHPSYPSHPSHPSHPPHSPRSAHPSHSSLPQQGLHAQQGASYPGAAYPAHAPPLPGPFAQTSLMPPMPPNVSLENLPGAGGPPPVTAPLQPFTMPPLSPMHGASMPGVPMAGVPAFDMHGQPAMYGQHPAQHPGQHLPPDAGQMTTFPPGSQGSHAFAASAGPHAMPFDANVPVSEPRPSERPAGAASYAVAIGVGVLLAVLIGVSGFLAWRGRATPTHAESTPASSPTPVPVSAVPPAIGASGASGGGGTAVQASPEITFRIVPAEATLSVDGRDLAADARVVPRPAVGKTATVVVRANGHEDSTVLVDFFTTSPMTLTLKPAAAAASPGTEPGAVVGDIDVDPPKDAPGPKDPPLKKDPPKTSATGEGPRVVKPPKGDPALPPNPF